MRASFPRTAPPPTPARVVVVGGGIAGLTLGYRLMQRAAAEGRALDVTVLEAGRRAGGHATTIREEGFLVEAGPNGFLDRWREPRTRALVAELGLEPHMIEARPQSRRRYILHRGRLRLAPSAPPTLFSTDLLSVPGKLRLVLEPFARPAPPGAEETVWEFAARRIGREAADRLVDAAISGISAGDSRELSVEAAFPLMTEMEREHGSLIAAMLATRRKPVPRLFSFEGGLATLIGALTDRLGPRLRTGAAAERIERDGRSWRVTLAGGERLAADHVVLTIAAHETARLVRRLDPPLADALDGQPFAGLAMVALAFRESDVPRPLDGYGYLVGRDEGLDTLGVVWESSLFDGRAPAGMVLLRVMIGGVRRPEIARLDPDALAARARRELEPVLGIRAEPVRTWVRRWPASIAQYTLGHLSRIERIRALAIAHPGLVLAGTSYDGASFTSAVASAERRAAELLDAIATAPAVLAPPASLETLPVPAIP